MDLLSVILLLAAVCHVHSRCPRECRCHSGRVVCDLGGMKRLPVSEMDEGTQVLDISAPRERPNNLTIGRMFMDFRQLEEVRIVDSNIPAIGESSFWPGKQLRLLDLSRNNLTFLHAADFNGLKSLEVLDLSDNNINATPSAPFRYLSSLTSLSLARNKLKTLVPRFFYLLPHLQYLDLSGNPFREVDPENLQDVGQLRTLRLADCHLAGLPPALFTLMPLLEELDLRNNEISALGPREFGRLQLLKVLRLDGNRLTTVKDHTFFGHRLQHLGLAGNQLASLAPCGFCNCSVDFLDLSRNPLQDVTTDSGLSRSVRVLNASFSSLSGQGVANLVRGLAALKTLDLFGSEVTSLPEETFVTLPGLQSLNMSHSKLETLAAGVIRPLATIRNLDLSHNELAGLSAALLTQLDAKAATLTSLALDGNPWTCTRCDILPLVTWANTSFLYDATCGDSCLRCEYPPEMSGRRVAGLREEELEPCSITPITQSQVLVVTSQLGVIVAAAVVLLLVPIVLVVVVLYRRQGAVYYTHEGERARPGVYEHLTAGDLNGYGDDKKPVFFTTDDRREETQVPSKHG